ncbi:MAG TPA: hypothetical protein VD968_00065 [Pyrinomonadaceae bacterium]|nr:hypothetical protein [Pyrinomonadaceae bacterium]
MRWKLLIAATLAATLVGAGGCLAAAHFLLGSAGSLPFGGGLAASAALLVPVAAVTFATVFVYRHTARRRALQAAATALLASALTLAALATGAALLGPPAPDPSAPPAPPTKA